MDCKTGEIHNIYNEDPFLNGEEVTRESLEKETGRKMLALTRSEYSELKPLRHKKRKNVMRNKPCVCGSGKKFKKCCWGKYV